MDVIAPLSLALLLGLPDDEPGPPNFEQHVQPILRESCLKCHRGSRAKNGLELRSVDAILEGGSSGPAIVPGDPGSSLLYLVATHEREPAMPPSGDKLSEEALATLAAWIEGGAVAVPGGPPAGGASRASEITYVPPPAEPGTAVLPEGVPTQPLWWTERGTPVRALATSPGAPLAAVAGHQQIALYSLPEAQLLGVLPYPEGEVHSLSFSANGGLLLAGGGRSGERGSAVGFDVRTGARLFSVGDEPDAVLGADIGPQHWLVALGGPDRRVRAYSARSGELLYELEDHTDWVTEVALSPDGVLLASGDRAGGVFVWEALRGREFHALPAQRGAVSGLAWRADSNRLAVAGEDGRVRLFELENGREVRAWNAKSAVLDLANYYRFPRSRRLERIFR